MRERWVVMAKRADFAQIGRRFSVDPVIARIIRNRDIVNEEEIESFLYGKKEQLHSPWLLKDMDRAVELVLGAVKKKRKIRIIGDYDIDGVMSTHILLEGFRRLGAVVDICIPDRVADGYGLHRHLVDRAAGDGVEMIVTCDNGISAPEEIAYAGDLGMTVVVTDHHNIPYEETDGQRRELLPPAAAVINPHRSDCDYPFKNLCGAAVAYKLVCALYEKAGISVSEQEKFLELVAVATVGDVMDLLGENRIFVKEGIKMLQNPRNRGLRALIEETGLQGRTLNTYHIGFVIGPCINASGRLDTAVRSLKLLQAKTDAEAGKLAQELTALNEERKAMTLAGVEQAVEQVESSALKEDRVLVVYLPDCHESLAGIIAGRLREKYYKPSFVLTKGEEYVKGSGRSIEDFSMFDEMTKCKEVFVQYGGHPMAAGLSVRWEDVEEFRRKINENCTLTLEQLAEKVKIDVPMPLSYIKPELIEQMAVLEPFGKGNPRPRFAQQAVTVAGHRIVGKNRNVMKLTFLDDKGRKWDGVYFGDCEQMEEAIRNSGKLSIIYYPEFNEWQGNVSIQIVVEHYKPA